MIEVGEHREWFGAQSSLKFLLVKYLRDPKSGKPLQWFPHYDEWYAIARDQLRSDIQAPRGHGKSIFWSYALPLWDVIRGKADVLLVSYSEDQVRQLIRAIKNEVENNPFLSPLRPSTREIWGTDMLTFADAGQISGLGFGTSSRGRHPKRMIVDDPLKDLGGMSQDDQERAYFGVITGMALENTQLHTVGTPIEFGDLLEKLEKNSVYHHWKKPALKSNGEPLCPQLFSLKTLHMRREEMGSLNFAREFMLQRIDPATQPFKRQYETLYTELPSRWSRIVTVCDPAYTEEDGDYTAIVTVAFTHGNQAYVLEAKGIRREDPGKIVTELIRTIRNYKPEAVGIEKKKGQAIEYSFREACTRENLWNFKYVELMHHGQGKWSPNRIGGLVSRWEMRSIHIHAEMNLLKAQIYAYRPDDKSREHDDLVDALAYCFHPDLVQPNAGRMNVPLDVESASQEGRPRYQVGQGDAWAPQDTYAWATGKVNYGRSWSQAIDKRIGDAV